MSATDTGLSVDVSQLKLLKSLKQAKPDEKAEGAIPALDMKRMIEQMFETQFTKPVGGAEADPRDLAAEIRVDGKPVDRIYTSGNANDEAALGPLKPGAEGARDAIRDWTRPDLAQNRAEDIAEARGGKTAKTSGIAAAQDAKAAPLRHVTNDWDAIEREKQQWYAGIKSLRTIGDPSMLVQAQLFAQQGAGVE